ncbi:hypothetical protein SGPA1_21849 [Streptomyces misionensis JCM 4497]
MLVVGGRPWGEQATRRAPLDVESDVWIRHEVKPPAPLVSYCY